MSTPPAVEMLIESMGRPKDAERIEFVGYLSKTFRLSSDLLNEFEEKVSCGEQSQFLRSILREALKTIGKSSTE